MRDNFFIILDLRIDPPEDNASVIRKAISDKCAEWTKTAAMGAGKARQKAEQFLSMKSEIESVMLDSSARKKEAADAMAQKKAALSELSEKIKMLLTTVGAIKPNVKKSLAANYKKYGISEKDIDKIIGARDHDVDEEVEHLEIISIDYIRKIRLNLDAFGEKDLYTFLKKKSTASPDELVRAGEELRKKFASDATGGPKVKPGLELAASFSTSTFGAE